MPTLGNVFIARRSREWRVESTQVISEPACSTEHEEFHPDGLK